MGGVWLCLSLPPSQRTIFMDTSKRLARYFLEQLPEDYVAYWDFDAPQGQDTPRDSSASAIFVCGILELLEHLPEDDPDRAFLDEAVHKSIASW